MPDDGAADKSPTGGAYGCALGTGPLPLLAHDDNALNFVAPVY